MPKRRFSKEPRYCPVELRGMVARADCAPIEEYVEVMPCNGSRFRAVIKEVEETFQKGNLRVRILQPGAAREKFIGGGTAVLILNRR